MIEEEKKIFLEWELLLRDISQFVQLAKINGIKYEVRTDEQSGHHRPPSACLYIKRLYVRCYRQRRYSGLQRKDFPCTKENGTRMDREEQGFGRRKVEYLFKWTQDTCFMTRTACERLMGALAWWQPYPQI